MIRAFKTVDLDTVMRIWLETNIKAHDFIGQRYWQGNYEIVREMCEDNNIIQGFIGSIENYIAGVFVDVHSQCQGIGKSLLDYIRENRSALSLQVYKKNVRAVKFYLRENFEVSKENG